MNIDDIKNKAEDAGDDAQQHLDNAADEVKSKADDLGEDIQGHLGGEKKHSEIESADDS